MLNSSENCRDCQAATGFWWIGRGAAYLLSGAANSRCEDCYKRYCREKYRKRTGGSPQRYGRRPGPTHCDLTPCVECGCPARPINGLSNQGKPRLTRCVPCKAFARANYKSAAEGRRTLAILTGERGITWRTVGERDGWVCHLCSEVVERVAGAASVPFGATVDHLVPIASGGAHVLSNVALAHRRCNTSRGAKPLAVAA